MAKRDRTRDGRTFKGGVKDMKETRAAVPRGARRVGVDATDLRRRDPRAAQDVLAREAIRYVRAIVPGTW